MRGGRLTLERDSSQLGVHSKRKTFDILSPRRGIRKWCLSGVSSARNTPKSNNSAAHLTFYAVLTRQVKCLDSGDKDVDPGPRQDSVLHEKTLVSRWGEEG